MKKFLIALVAFVSLSATADNKPNTLCLVFSEGLSQCFVLSDHAKEVVRKTGVYTVAALSKEETEQWLAGSRLYLVDKSLGMPPMVDNRFLRNPGSRTTTSYELVRPQDPKIFK